MLDHSTNNLSAVNPIKETHKPMTKPLPPSLKDSALKISCYKSTVPINPAIITIKSANIKV